MEKICLLPDCDKVSRALNYCNAHYKKFKIYGDPMGGKPSLAERFWAKVKKGDGCWEWQASLTGSGYGQFSIGYGLSMRGAHRMSYELAYGDIPQGMDIDHVCHNKICVRPDHLRVATRKQNMEHRMGAQKNSTSGVRGVFWTETCGGRWSARVMHNRRNIHVGYFSTLEAAEAAVTAKRLELFTHNDLDRIAA